MDSKLTESRLIQHEKERCRSAKTKSNVLFFNFRDDINKEAQEKFKALKISENRLEKWQRGYHFLYPWNTEYYDVRENVNRKFVVYPLIIAMCESDKDVKKAFKIAKKYKLNFSLRSGSHCIEAFSLSEGILIDQSRRQKYKIDTSERTLTIEPGVLIGPTIYELSKVNLVIPFGSCNNVSIAGLSLGGGIGSLTRSYGMTCDHILSADILLANGKIITVDKHTPDLYFAIRGAGNGNFGIITSMKFKLHYVPKLIYFEFNYDFKYIRNVIDIWQNWILSITPNMNSELRLSNRGGNIKVNGIYIGSKKKALKYLESLFSVCAISTTIEKRTWEEIAVEFAGKGRWLPFTKAKNRYSKSLLSKEAINIIAENMAKGSGNSILELNGLGGAANAVGKNETAYVHRDSLIWVLINSHWESSISGCNEKGDSELIWLNNFIDQLSPHLDFSSYVNIPDIDLDYPLERYYGSNLPRLQEIKKKYDPDNLFQYSQSINFPKC